MKLYLFLAAVLGLSGPQANAAEAKRYRWFPKISLPIPNLLSSAGSKVSAEEKLPSPIVVPLDQGADRPKLLPLKGELLKKSVQGVGPAVVDGTWTQTIFQPNGQMIYAAGAVFDELPQDEWLTRVKEMKAHEAEAIRAAEDLVPGYRAASKRLDPELRLRKRSNGEFEAYWRMEYLGPHHDQVFYLSIGERGDLLETGEVAVPGLDGKAMVFPLGPKWSEVTEVPLRQLSGDGTLSSRFFRVVSALNLDVRSPNLLFFFPESDRRFDLSQVYFTIEKSLQWMQEQLGVALKAPLEVKLHIGNNGVSNAAFYHQNVIYLGTGDGVTYKDLTRDPSVVVHESIHAMIDTYAGLPSEGEGGSFNEGFADFFTALILKNPHMGNNSYMKGPYRRTLENDFKAYRDFADGTYKNGSVIAGTLWDMRAILSDEKLAQLAFRTLTRMGRGARFDDFASAVVHAGGGLLTAEEQLGVTEKLLARGWAIR